MIAPAAEWTSPALAVIGESRSGCAITEPLDRRGVARYLAGMGDRDSRMGARARLAARLALVFVAGCGGAQTRDLGCERENVPRAREICVAVADNLKLGWGGENASFAPVYTLGSRDLARLYCDLRIAPSDGDLLVAMQTSAREPRLSEAARELHHLLFPSEAMAGTRYHPSHPRYVLRGGCPLLHRTRPR